MTNLARTHPLLTTLALTAVVVSCYLALPADTLEAATLQTACLAVATVACLALLTPGRIRRPRAGTSRATLCVGIGILAVGAVCTTVAFWYPLPSGTSQGSPDWRLFPLVIVFCLATGLFEEGLFRGVLTDALIRGLAGRRGGVFLAAAVSSGIFGLLHISGGLADANNVVSLWQMVLKPVQAGLFGFVMAGLYLRTHNITGIALLHAVYDLIVMTPYLLVSGALPTGYVTGDTGDLLILVLSTVLLAPLALWAGRSILKLGQSQTR